MTIHLPNERGNKSTDKNDINRMGKEDVEVDLSQKKGRFPLG
jgi:hypothetical protein